MLTNTLAVHVILINSLLAYAHTGVNAAEIPDSNNAYTHSPPDPKTIPDEFRFDVFGTALGDPMASVLKKWGFTEADIQTDSPYRNAAWLKATAKKISIEKFRALESEWNQLAPKVYVLAIGKGEHRRAVKKGDTSYLAYFDHQKRLQRSVITVDYPQNIDAKKAVESLLKYLVTADFSKDQTESAIDDLGEAGVFQIQQDIENGRIAIAGSNKSGRLVIKYAAVGNIKEVDDSMNSIVIQNKNVLLAKYGIK